LKIIFKNFIHLDEKEANYILEIRNQKNIKYNMKNNETISLENHLHFINSLKTSENKKYFAILQKNEIIGSVYYVKNKELFFGLYFKEEINPILKSCVTYLFLEYIFNKFYEEINSFVKKSNIIALSFNKNFGFKNFEEDKEFIYLKLSSKNWENQKKSKLLKPIKKYLDKMEYQFRD
jgi:UDP-4-amino-4,6-dideoxy-N-acetyl-beta-L-altrosamine N-acetyltransferase